ncbi:aminotransferase class IV [Sulfurospirillum barnesii]|uniref:Branched-chain amino acid aminotransferase/4-amino-4-deoxychorismate lyase n=1 Tax=Sulfurospirillum barnesii (strain ATCC 700032 / DSM 10660 / SES-3) TaxID=760154 RepID=I3XYG9_SULBS|nr:aminotransferase class IV [Sulfurospirillum barnesii]AFL68993.1 branched-chain amino acid aminotransferase/4-amino-4-deoxychorismate lyase [Sulfurospirillum barnesii SES-3]
MRCAIKSISPCFETIKVQDGYLYHLAFHQARFDKTRHALYGAKESIRLSEHLTPPKEGLYRVRVEYTSGIEKVEYFPYVPRLFERFLVMERDELSYAYKYCDRTLLATDLQGKFDDVIFTCKDVLKDTSIANIALLIDGQWYTPTHPLLEGTTRARLLLSGFLKEAPLRRQSLQKAQKFAIMNALIGFKILHNVLIKE